MNKSKVKIIAEIGINHNGDMNIVKKLIDVAADANCDGKISKKNNRNVYSEEILDFLEKVHGVLLKENRKMD